MTLEIALVLTLLGTSVLFLVTEWIPMEVTALLSLGVVALTGLISPVEALSGFSNPAVVTIWAVFIVSGGLTHTGVANVIGSFVLRMAGTREVTMIIVIMLTAGVLSAIMNNVAVAALMLPVVMDISRDTGHSPSRLLMPLAYGALLGGLTTQIGTPPNILVTDALREAGLPSFTFFDFTPVGLIIMFSGVAFMALIGRHLLPENGLGNMTKSGSKKNWLAQYELNERIFHVRVPDNSVLLGKALAQIRMASILGWNVVAIIRGDRTKIAPGPLSTLQAGDILMIEGRIEASKELHLWLDLVVEEESVDLEASYWGEVKIGEVALPNSSSFIGSTLNSLKFRSRFGLNVLAILRKNQVQRVGMQDIPLQEDDMLLVAGPDNSLKELEETAGFGRFRYASRADLIKTYHLDERLKFMVIPTDSFLEGQSLKESRFGDVLGSRVLGIFRGKSTIPMPKSEEILQAGDRLLVEGRSADMEILQGLEELQIDHHSHPDVQKLVSENGGLVEAVLSPKTTLEGKTLRQIHFREKFGLSVLALWHRGQAYRSHLRNKELRFGDALLLLGSRDKLKLLGQEPDFIVLTEAAQVEVRRDKMKVSLTILTIMLVPVIVGWVPIYIAAVVGAALMVLTGCLSMEEAYRQIEWKAVFLIAGMLPLGMALDRTGAAQLIAEGVVATVGPFGPNAVMFGLVGLTFMATCFVPTAALVVLMAPIALKTSTDMGLSPNGLMMAIAMAASASFTTPVAHPANILVMGPGGYRFTDYLKVGGLLTLVIFAVIMVFMPIFWPLAG